MAIKWAKMMLEISLKNENEANLIFFNLSVLDFSYLIKKNDDVINDTWQRCPCTVTLALNGLNKIPKTENFPLVGVFRTKVDKKYILAEFLKKNCIFGSTLTH